MIQARHSGAGACFDVSQRADGIAGAPRVFSIPSFRRRRFFMNSLVHEPMLKSDPPGQIGVRGMPIVVETIPKGCRARMIRSRNTNEEAPGRSGGISKDATEHPRDDDKRRETDETLAPGQSPTPPGEVRPGHNPEKPQATTFSCVVIGRMVLRMPAHKHLRYARACHCVSKFVVRARSSA